MLRLAPPQFILPANIVRFDADAAVDCVLCGYDQNGVMRNVGGWRRIYDTRTHARGRDHSGRYLRGGMLWPHVAAWGQNGTPYIPSPPEDRYRGLACSLTPAGLPKVRNWYMEYGPMMQHVLGAQHVRRCGDDDPRMRLFAARGVDWAVPVVVAQAVPVVVAQAPVVVPLAPVVVPRQPQP